MDEFLMRHFIMHLNFLQGTIADSETFFALDKCHNFESGRPMLVCGNTAAIAQESWLKDHFSVLGTRATHYGHFIDSNVPSKKSSNEADPDCSACIS